MRALILAGLAAVTLSACAEITDRTGITPAQQMCLAEAFANADSDMNPLERAIWAAQQCGVTVGTAQVFFAE